MTISSKEITQILKLLQEVTLDEKKEILRIITSDPQALECSQAHAVWRQETVTPVAP